MNSPSTRAIVFIDGANLYHALKVIGVRAYLAYRATVARLAWRSDAVVCTGQIDLADAVELILQDRREDALREVPPKSTREAIASGGPTRRG